MPRWSDGVGRTVLVAGIAGALFAGFLALTPRLTASQVALPTATTVTGPVATSLPGIADPVVAIPVDVQVTVTTEPVTVLPPTGEDSPESPGELPDPSFGGTIQMAVDARPAGAAAAEGILVEGEELQWRFTVENTSAEELWGTYVYLELHGPASCDQHHLLPGASTDCWIATTAVEGIHTAHAWATSWTLDRQVRATIQYSFEVTL
jgi:hypothetical protein